MKNNGNKLCTGNSRQINMFFLMKKSIAYCSTEHMLSDFFTK